MSIKLVPDLGAPVAVVAVDLMTDRYAPKYNEWIAYLLAIGGYVAGWMEWGGDFMKNVGIASLPWAAKKVYTRITSRAAASQRLALSRPVSKVSRYPAPAPAIQFQDVRLI